MTATIEFFENVITALKLDEDNPQCIEQFDDRRFRFGAYLLNPDGNGIKIRKGAIEELIIIDDILDWFHTGHMTFSNPHDIMERVTSQYTSDTTDGGKIDITPYTVRGDARDFLFIKMEPYIDSDDATTGKMYCTYDEIFVFNICNRGCCVSEWFKR